MHTREEILQIYYAGSENVIAVIKDLEMKLQNQKEIIEQQKVMITTLKEQAKVSQDTEFLYIKLKEQMERIESQLKMLNKK